ncbi:choice-of-anchor J domain-containing protein [Hyunsoonleella sp. 2307UL5-6]|uniref:choice-of-anchor J domain-containing protein n=1 Tax=Hyunsoonleella sp. 2307UL5-6 TaxID=3384768 RepID=UPI0039BC4953
MKNLNYLIVTFLCGVLLVSCNDELDEAFREAGEATPILNDITYELTSDDFEGFDDEEDDFYEIFNAFPSIEDAEIKIAPILSNRINTAVDGLNVFVDVSYTPGGNTNDEDFLRYITADKYELRASDYPTQGSGAFLPSESEESFLETIVARVNSTPQEGDITRVEYLKFNEAPEDGTRVISETNFGAFEGWIPVDITGDQSWSEGVDFGNVQMSGFSSGSNFENEDWLVSPVLDFSDSANLRIQINQNFRFGNPDNLGIQVLIATDYTGDVTTATWEEVTFTTVPTNNDNDYVLSEDVDVSNFDGEIVNIALKYESTDSASTRWRVRQINVKAGGLEGSTDQLFAFLRYNGTNWEILDEDNVYVLKDTDYDEMGAPGRFNNFSNSVLPENYLPTFVAREFPFAQEDDNIFLVYQFFFGGSTGTLTRGTFYEFGTSWLAPAATLKFTYNNGRWEPNNAIPYEFISDDYERVVTELASIEDLADELENLERFGNFNRREGGSTFWDEDELLLAFNIVLKANFPDTEVGKRYEITISAFPTGTETYLLELSESGDYIYVIQ